MKKLWIIALLLLIGLTSAGSWLLLTRSGALWLLARLEAQSPVKIALTDLRGSLLGGLELHELQVEWPAGRLKSAALQLRWNPSALVQRQLQLELLQLGTLELQLSGTEKKPPAALPEQRPLLPDLKPWLALLGGWSINLEKLQIDSLQLTGPDGSVTRLEQLTCRLNCATQQLAVSEFEFAGDLGRWRGGLQFAAEEQRLTAQLGWQPLQPIGPLETFEAQLSLQRTPPGGLVGPVTLKGQKANGFSYRLAGDLQLDLNGLQLQRLQLERGKAAGAVRGDLTLGWTPRFAWQTVLNLEALNLAEELGHATSISGKLSLHGTQNTYAGHIDLRNAGQGWELLGLRAELKGDAERLDLRQLEASVLAGKIRGELDLNWREGIASSFRLGGEELQLDLIPAGPDGKIDMRVDGWLKKAPNRELQLGGNVQITKGILLHRDLHGELSGTWQGGRQLQLDSLDLRGAWGELKAQGDLQQHLQVNLDLHDAAALWPPLQGAGTLDGWLAWSADWPHGELAAQLHGLAYQDWQLKQLAFSGIQPAAGDEAELQLELNQLSKGDIALEGLSLKAQGLPRAHRLLLKISENGHRAELDLRGALQQQEWRGTLLNLDLVAREIESFSLEQPVALSIGAQRIGFSEALLKGDRGGHLSLSGDWDRPAGRRQIAATWQDFNLSWLKLWLAALQFDGKSSGQGTFVQDPATGSAIELQTEYVGTLGYAGKRLQIDKAQLAGRWNKQGLVIDAELRDRSGGNLTLTASSSERVDLFLPRTGNFALDLKGFLLSLLAMKMPPGTELSGRLAAQVDGRWWEGGQFGLAGKVGVAQGAFSYVDAQSRLEIPIEQAGIDFDWQANQLQAELSLGLGAGDGLTGDLSLQLPARWPFDPAQNIPLEGALQFQLGQLGVLSLLVPEKLADFGGEIGGALRLGGSLRQPNFSGDFHLVDGSLSLPQLGIVLEQIGLQAVFSPQQLNLNQIELHSGAGQLIGRGEILFVGWKPERLNLELQGDDVLIVNLPELRAVASPDLQIVGDKAGFTLGGMLKIPELQIVNWHPTGRIVHSEDLIYVDSLPKPEPPPPLKLNLDLDVELGDRVLVKDRGLDVKLKGKIHLNRPAGGGVLARGQIDIPAGHYSAYGVKLPITSGRLFFNGGPVDNPALDIIAAKKVKEVTAGVSVGGTARRPEIRLISDPTLDDTDILSYIVLGRSTSGGSGDLSVLSLAAGAVLSAGDSASFQQKLQNKSGLDVIDVSAGEQGALESSVVTVGKYLSPELYLSYGRALSSSVSQAQLRYSPTKRVDIESQLGEVSGADLYYRIDFGGN